MKKYQHPVAFTGAGISVASGLPTFDITWEGVPVRDLLTRQLFDSNPARFYQFFKEIESWRDKEPNSAHLAIARAGIPVVTQNIDGLHQKAGSKAVYEIHGNLRQMVCSACGKIQPWISLTGQIPYCECKGILGPRVVLFGDSLLEWDEAEAEMRQADLVLVVGCSLTVAPACYLPQMAQMNGAKIIQINEKAEVQLPETMMELGIL